MPSLASNLIAKLALTDAQPAFRLWTNGVLEWGPGAATVPDTALYRAGAGILATDGFFKIGSGTANEGIRFSNVSSNSNGAIWRSSVDSGLEIQAQTHIRLRTPGGSKVWISDLAGIQDTDLYRFSASFLATAADFGARMGSTGQVTFQSAGGLPVIYFGNAQDTNLYRSAADRLKSDDLFDATVLALATKVKAGTPVDADWAAAPPSGTIVVDSTANKLWVRVGTVWKGVVLA